MPDTPQHDVASSNSNLPSLPRIAAIDIGSNSIRLVVAQILPGGTYRILDEERENTRLASSLNATGQLSPEAIAKTIVALKNFVSIATGYQVQKTRTIATSAVRAAKNGAAFCDQVQQEIGLKVTIISSEEEARLAFHSVSKAFDISTRNIAVADIGGGSTEIILASSGMIDQIFPTKLGAVRVAEKCNALDRCAGPKLTDMIDYIDRQLKKHAKKPSFEPSILFGTGGTFTAMANMIMAAEGNAGEPVWGFRVTRAQIRHLLEDLSNLTLEKRRKVAGLNPRRADIIVAGIAILERIMRHLQVNLVQVNGRGIRDGLLLTMIQDLQDHTVSPKERREAVEAFATHCGVDLRHAIQVGKIAGQLLQQLAQPLGLNPEDRDLIETSALLANVGYLINFDKHHKHSYQLILNSELPGFERHELQLLANIARYHRGAPPKLKHGNYAQLSSTNQERVAQLAAILRLALALDRTHQQQVAKVSCYVTNTAVTIEVLVKENADVDLWAARRKVELFEQVFNRKVEFRTMDETLTNNQKPQNEEA